MTNSSINANINIEELIGRVKPTTEYHYPGYSFMGPGTNLITRLSKNDEPKSFVDSLAKQHDLDFLLSSGDYFDGLKANIKAILGATTDPFRLDSLAMRVGLSFENLLRTITFGKVKFNTALPNLSDAETKLVGKYLQNKYYKT